MEQKKSSKSLRKLVLIAAAALLVAGYATRRITREPSEEKIQSILDYTERSPVHTTQSPGGDITYFKGFISEGRTLYVEYTPSRGESYKMTDGDDLMFGQHHGTYIAMGDGGLRFRLTTDLDGVLTRGKSGYRGVSMRNKCADLVNEIHAAMEDLEVKENP